MLRVVPSQTTAPPYRPPPTTMKLAMLAGPKRPSSALPAGTTGPRTAPPLMPFRRRATPARHYPLRRSATRRAADSAFSNIYCAFVHDHPSSRPIALADIPRQYFIKSTILSTSRNPLSILNTVSLASTRKNEKGASRSFSSKDEAGKKTSSGLTFHLSETYTYVENFAAPRSGSQSWAHLTSTSKHSPVASRSTAPPL